MSGPVRGGTVPAARSTDVQSTAAPSPDVQSTAELSPDVQPTAELSPDAQSTAEPSPDVQPTAELSPDAQSTAEPSPDAPSPELDALRRRFDGYVPGLLGAEQEYAVLCPLVQRPDGLSLLFEVRAAGIRQAGEVCFPGGRMEPGENAVQCALRETEEELSIPRREISILGTPDFLCNARGFLVRPVLGYVSAAGLSAMRPSPAEAADTFTVPLSFFRDNPPQVYVYDLTPAPPAGFPYGAAGISPDYPWAAGRTEVPVWFWEGRAVWGMTARLIRGLL